MKCQNCGYEHISQDADSCPECGSKLPKPSNPSSQISVVQDIEKVSDRAEVIGVKMESVGIAERAERMLILAAVSIIGYFYLPALGYGVALIAALSIITVLQRVWHVYKELKKEKQ